MFKKTILQGTTAKAELVKYITFEIFKNSAPKLVKYIYILDQWTL